MYHQMAGNTCGVIEVADIGQTIVVNGVDEYQDTTEAHTSYQVPEQVHAWDNQLEIPDEATPERK